MKYGSKHSRFAPVELGKIDGTRAVLETVPEKMTAFGGAPMLAKIERKVGLLAGLDTLINDPRDQNLIQHQSLEILIQRACQIATGNIDLNDAEWLRGDPAIAASLGRHPVDGRPGASQETISRFETNAISKENIESVQNLLVDHYLKRNKKRPKKIELDIDGMMFKTYGAQEGTIYRGGKYKHEMYFPLMMFIGGWLVAATLRLGDQGESSTVLPELKRIVARLRQQWPNVKIIARMDAAFASADLLRWCRQERIGYQIGLRPNSVLTQFAKQYIEEAEQKFREQFGEPKFLGKDGNKKAHAEHANTRKLSNKEERMAQEKAQRQRRVRVIGNLGYKAESWEQLECVVVRADYTDNGLDIRYVAVSERYAIPQQAYEDDYCKRGLMEQFNGRFKQTGQRLSAQTFYANQFRMIMYGVTYQLLFHLHEYVSKHLKQSDVNTVRKTLMIMPMVVRHTDKKIVFQVSEQHPHCKEFLSTWRRLSAA